MPYSSDEGKQFTRDVLLGFKNINHILDIGPGAGTYYNLLSRSFPDAIWTCVEAWGPYVKKFSLQDKYTSIIIDDARTIDWQSLGTYDIVIFGDVLEHMSKEEAENLVRAAHTVSRYMVISIPIIHYPQGDLEGNPYEVHQHHWSPESVKSDLLGGYTIEQFAEYSVVGVYIVRGRLQDE